MHHRDWDQVQLDVMRSFTRIIRGLSNGKFPWRMSRARRVPSPDRSHPCLRAYDRRALAGTFPGDAMQALGASDPQLPDPAPVAPLLPGAGARQRPTPHTLCDAPTNRPISPGRPMDAPQGFGDICSVFLIMFGADDAAALVERVATDMLRCVFPSVTLRTAPNSTAAVPPFSLPLSFGVRCRDTLRPNFDKVEAKLALIWPLLQAADPSVCDALARCVRRHSGGCMQDGSLMLTACTVCERGGADDAGYPDCGMAGAASTRLWH